MKLKSILFVTALLSSSFCFAEEVQATAAEQQAPSAAAADTAKDTAASDMPKAMKARLLKEFDKDGDGFLNKDELDAAKKVLAQRQQKFEEMQKRHAARILKQYDKDGDAKLSQEELIPLLENQMRMLFEARSDNRGNAKKGDMRPNFRGGKNAPDMPPPPPSAGAEDKPQAQSDSAPANVRRDRRPRGDFEKGKGRPEAPRRDMRRPTEADLDALAKPVSE